MRDCVPTRLLSLSVDTSPLFISLESERGSSSRRFDNHVFRSDCPSSFGEALAAKLVITAATAKQFSFAAVK